MGIATPSSAQVLLGILDNIQAATPLTDAMADKAVSDYLVELQRLNALHNKKRPPAAYLIEQVFGRGRAFTDTKAYIPFARCHLWVALEQFTNLVSQMRDPANGAITVGQIVRYKDTLRDYLFDLLDFVPFLQRKVAGYVYFSGAKSFGVHTWQLYLLSQSLASHAAHRTALDNKAAQIASIVTLRQALELRFQRLVSVYPTDKKGKPPKLRHGFHYDFIVENGRFFHAPGVDFTGLKHLYDWCSEVVHQAYQPYAWQVAWAVERGGQLLGAQAATGGHWNLANAVTISDVEAMQAAFEAHFLQTYSHGEWRMIRMRPEALITNWNAQMALTSPDFRPVAHRPNLWARAGLWLQRKLGRK